MINKLLSISLILTATASMAIADSYVSGYPRMDGTYVAPHYRSLSDSGYNNSWAVSPKINPYTGKQGYRNPTWYVDPHYRSSSDSSYSNSWAVSPKINPYTGKH